jgi:hypothetical protein
LQSSFLACVVCTLFGFKRLEDRAGQGLENEVTAQIKLERAKLGLP